VVEWVIPVPVAVRPEQPPASSPLDWEWNVPSLQNEQDFYTNVMGWTIPSGEPNFDNTFTGSYSWLSASGWGFGTIHSDTEGDDLWVWDQQKKRYGSSFTVEGADTVGDWRTALLAEYKASLLSALDQGTESSQFYDHMYGQGLAVIYNDTQDPDILTVFDELRSRITGLSSYQEIISSGTTEVAHYEGRYVGRPALSAAYIAKATSDSDWITIRDNYKTAYETSPDWEEGGVIVGGGGMYFASREQASYISGSGGTAAYDAGRRFHSSFQIGIIAEVMWRMYVESGSTILRDRLIKMARYVLRYAHVPSWDYPHVGSRFGHEGDGSRWHKDTGDSTATTAAKDCSYDAGLVNLMVFGYKLTGDQELLDFARTLFTRCNRYLPGGGGAFRAASQNHLLKYMDTTPNNVQRRLQWNKGVLQYAYQVFENGGDIQTETYGGTIEALADGMSSNTWLEITSSMDNSNLKSLTLNTAGTLRSAFEYSHQFFWNSVSKELHFRGGGASSGSDATQRHVRFGDTRGTWDAVTGWVNPGYVHQWNQFTGDPRTGNLYHRRPNNTDIIKWTYADYPATPAWTSFVQGGWGNSYNAESFEFFPDLNDGDGGFDLVFKCRCNIMEFVGECFWCK
jgi:hypothetical protein